LAEENLKITTERQAQTTQQLERLLKLIKAGTMPTGARLDLDAQLARDEQAIVQAQNTIDLAILNLKTLLNLPPQEAMLIEQPAVLLPLDKVEEWNAQTLYEQAIGNQPNLKAAELRRQSAELGIDIAESRLKPRVSAFAQMNTNYSSLGKRVEGFTPATQYLGTVDVAGQLFPLNINTQQPIVDNNPYFSQIGQNFSQAVGVSVTVPIYNAGQNKIAIERAKLGVISADLQTQQLRRQLFTDIQRSLADAIAALKQFQAAERTQTAVELALRNTEKRVQAGAGNAFEYTIARGNADTAAINLLVAKYDYLFKLKVLDFYRGIPLQN
jgi:outer membrane protein